MNIIKSFHLGLQVRVLDQVSFSEPFSITNGVKQGCVLTPTLFSIMLAALLADAIKSTASGIFMRYRVDGSVFNLQRLRAKTNVFHTVIRDPLFANDCALMAHTVEDIQELTTCFARAAGRFGLTISLKKTEVMHPPRHRFQ